MNIYRIKLTFSTSIVFLAFLLVSCENGDLIPPFDVCTNAEDDNFKIL